MAKYELPETPTEAEEEVRMSHCLERIVSFGAKHEDTKAWWEGTAKAAADKYIHELPDGMKGGRSWNHAVAAGTLYALMENKHWDRLKTYAVHQLDGTHKGLWGQEGTSHEYPHPIMYCAVAYERKQLPELKNLLRAHAFLLALLALPKPYQKDRGDSASEGPYGGSSTKLSLHVCAGGMRSQWPYRGNVSLSYALEIMRGKKPKIPTWRSTDKRREGWPNRVMRHTSHEYLSRGDRDLIENVIKKADVEPLVAELKKLGVRSRGTLHVLRYPADQGASYYETNTHPSTPPIMGQSWIRSSGYRTLSTAPDRLRGTRGGNSVGDVTAWLEGNKIFAKATGVVAAGELGNWPPCEIDGRRPPKPNEVSNVEGTVEASIPVPTDEPLWEVVIDRQGVTLKGSDGSGNGNNGGGNEDVKSALLLFDRVAKSSGDPWIQQGIATGAQVMKRIVLRAKGDAVKGSNTLTRQLEKPLSAPKGSTVEPRVKEALRHFSKAAKGSGNAWVQEGIEVGAQVMKRIVKPDRDDAIKGSKRLTRVLQA